jgi:hypothetical protein
MANIGNGGDLLCNFDLHSWVIGCHSSWDLVTTVTGDLALTKDEDENNRQRLLMWLALPKGERLNPKWGCCLHDYFHEKMTGNISRRLELDIRSDLKDVFPNMNIKNIAVTSVKASTEGLREISIDMSLGNDNLRFVADFNNIASVNEEINSLIYTGGAR